MRAPDYDLASAARAIADPARAAMLLRLMDGQAHTARNLASAAGVRPSAETSHLRHLAAAGPISVEADGRQKLHQLASPDVATAIEALAGVAPLLPVESLRDARPAGHHHPGVRLRPGRPRLPGLDRVGPAPGRLGSAVLTALLGRQWLASRPADRALTITPIGETRPSALGLFPLTSAAVLPPPNAVGAPRP